MADKYSQIVLDKEYYTKKLKRGFDSWREIVLYANSVLLWKKPSYPWILFAFTSLFFLKFIYYNPSFLTTVSLLGLVLTLLDYIGPLISNVIWKQDSWTATKERELEDVCRALAECIVTIKSCYSCIKEMRGSRPNMYYPKAIACLIILAWIGNSINNILITYVIVLQLILLPGLLHTGIIQKCYQAIMLQAANFLHSLSSPQKKKVQ